MGLSQTPKSHGSTEITWFTCTCLFSHKFSRTRSFSLKNSNNSLSHLFSSNRLKVSVFKINIYLGNSTVTGLLSKELLLCPNQPLYKIICNFCKRRLLALLIVLYSKSSTHLVSLVWPPLWCTMSYSSLYTAKSEKSNSCRFRVRFFAYFPEWEWRYGIDIDCRGIRNWCTMFILTREYKLWFWSYSHQSRVIVAPELALVWTNTSIPRILE